MFAVMVPAMAFSSAAVSSSWVIAGLFLAVLILANLPKDVAVRRVVVAGVVASFLGIGLAVIPEIIIRCTGIWWLC